MRTWSPLHRHLAQAVKDEARLESQLPYYASRWILEYTYMLIVTVTVPVVDVLVVVL